MVKPEAMKWRSNEKGKEGKMKFNPHGKLTAGQGGLNGVGCPGGNVRWETGDEGRVEEGDWSGERLGDGLERKFPTILDIEKDE
ncbi:hypothetical protein AJ78_04598 [Emergomyces pasteurianus Ep9510]|uniref:Uncharacterized protein n=1 Tax=Emergomyces pasteurianus Ep9510 TaxID=1447872 RepID=A0A1J9PF48_9EURO|nr:hypothetical protein AJ78_04598 [Emergomyces pasteurianus Ep9510]